VLKQEIVKGFELVLHTKREIFFEKKVLICKISVSPFPNDGIQGICNISKQVGGVEEISSNVL
jgi:hypothetical protein